MNNKTSSETMKVNIHHASEPKATMINKKAIKTIVLGAETTGKTALVTRCLTDQFFQHYFSKSDISYHIEKDNIAIDIMDSSGKNEALTSYADCVVMVYSIIDRKSLEYLELVIENVRRINMRNAVMAIVGTKNDKSIHREISTTEGETFAKTHNCLFFETSSFIPKYNTKDDIFIRLGKEAISKQRRSSDSSLLQKNRLVESIRNFLPRRRSEGAASYIYH